MVLTIIAAHVGFVLVVAAVVGLASPAYEKLENVGVLVAFLLVWLPLIVSLTLIATPP